MSGVTYIQGVSGERGRPLRRLLLGALLIVLPLLAVIGLYTFLLRGPGEDSQPAARPAPPPAPEPKPSEPGPAAPKPADNTQKTLILAGPAYEPVPEELVACLKSTVSDWPFAEVRLEEEGRKLVAEYGILQHKVRWGHVDTTYSTPPIYINVEGPCSDGFRITVLVRGEPPDAGQTSMLPTKYILRMKKTWLTQSETFALGGEEGTRRLEVTIEYGKKVDTGFAEKMKKALASFAEENKQEEDSPRENR
jgi:hypothetical protein